LGHIVVFRQLNAQFPQKKLGSFKLIEKKECECVKKCQTIIIALHTIATMFQKLHFISHAKPKNTKFAYKNYIPKISYSKLDSFNSRPQNERARKL